MTARSRSDIASEFLGLCAAGHVDRAFDTFVAADFIHHNAYFAGDRESLRFAMKESSAAEPNKSFDVKHTIEGDDRVAVLSHLRREQAGVEYAVVHILRFAGDTIVEMWDIGQQIPQDSPNTLGMF